jgi:predicted transcriptional regulator
MDKKPKAKKPIRFTKEQNALIDEGIAAMERGESMSAEEAHELARKRTKAWMGIEAKNLSA